MPAATRPTPPATSDATGREAPSATAAAKAASARPTDTSTARRTRVATGEPRLAGSLSIARPAFEDDSEAVHLPIERLPAQAELFGGARDAAVVAPQHALDRGALRGGRG